MKKYFLRLLVSLFLVALFFIFNSKIIYAKDGTACDFEYTTINGDQEVKLTCYISNDISVSIPDTVEVEGLGELPVTCIGPDAFSSCLNIGNVTGGNNIKHIDSKTFDGCNDLESIVLMELIEVPDGAFEGTSIISFVFPKVIIIGNDAFKDCDSLEFIYMENVQSIGDSAFADCDGLQNVTFKGTTTLGKEVFKNCKNLNNVNLPDVTDIGSDSFAGCTSEIYLKGSPYFVEYARKNGVRIKVDPAPNPNPEPENTDSTALLNKKLADLINKASKNNGRTVIYFNDYEGNDAISADIFNLLADNPDIVLVLDYIFYDENTKRNIHVHAVINQAILSKIVTADIKLYGPACLSGFVQYYGELPTDIRNQNY